MNRNKEVRKQAENVPVVGNVPAKQAENVPVASLYSCVYRTCIRNIIFSDEVLVDLTRRGNASSEKTELIGLCIK